MKERKPLSKSAVEVIISLFQTRIRGHESEFHCGAVWDVLPVSEQKNYSVNLRSLGPGVKINQLPGLHNLRRKDLLWTNYRQFRAKFGRWEIYNKIHFGIGNEFNSISW